MDNSQKNSVKVFRWVGDRVFPYNSINKSYYKWVISKTVLSIYLGDLGIIIQHTTLVINHITND